MTVERLLLSDRFAMQDWDSFVKRHPEGSPFHLSSWMSSIHETYAYEPHLYACRDGGGQIRGVFPLFLVRSRFTGTRLVSLPFSDYGGPLADDDASARNLLHQLRANWIDTAHYLEIRGSMECPSPFLRYDYFKRHVLALTPGIEALRSRIDKKTILYSIRRATKNGVEVRQENDHSGLLAFCRLNDLTRQKHGVPSQPRCFFENLFERIIVPEHGFILVARHEGEAIGAGIFLRMGNQIHYKYSASDPHACRRYSPNHLLTWHAISWAADNGFATIDFGRTAPDNAGLLRYKNMWGIEPIDLPYYYFPVIRGAIATKERSLTYRLMTGFWRHLPLSLSERASRLLYRHFG